MTQAPLLLSGHWNIPKEDGHQVDTHARQASQRLLYPLRIMLLPYQQDHLQQPVRQGENNAYRKYHENRFPSKLSLQEQSDLKSSGTTVS